MKRRLEILLVAMSLGVATGCGPAPDDQGSSAPALTLADLDGAWENSHLVLEVNSAGEFVVREPGGAGDTLLGGFVARDGEELSFVTSTTGECPGTTGVYLGDIEGEVLTLTLVDDPCAPRVTGFATPMTRSD